MESSLEFCQPLPEQSFICSPTCERNFSSVQGQYLFGLAKIYESDEMDKVLENIQMGVLYEKDDLKEVGARNSLPMTG